MAIGRKFYWIKIKDSFMTSDKVDFLMSQKNGANYVVLYQMLCLKTINTGGEMARELGEVIMPFDEGKIQRDCKYFEIDTIRIALELYKKLGMIYTNENGILQITDFKNMVGQETDYAHQKRIQRSNEVKQIDVDSSVDIVHIEIRDKDIRDKDKEKNKDALTSVASVIKPPIKSLTSVINEYTTNDGLRETLKDYKDMRLKMSKGFSTNAMKLILNKLSKLSSDDSEKIAIVNQSIENTWKGIFELKTDLPKKNFNNYGRKEIETEEDQLAKQRELVERLTSGNY